MNEHQRILLIASAALVFATLVFPPFAVHLPNGAVINMGYGFLLSPPSRGSLSATVNVATLIAQWAGIAILSGSGWLLLKDRGGAPLSQGVNLFGANAATKPGSSAGGAPKVLRAGFWRRVAAYLIDSLLLYFGLFVAFVLLAAFGLAMEEGAAERFGSLVGMATFWAYFATLESGSRQATVGKRVLGIKVVDLGGRPISFGRASGRHFGKLLSALILGIGFLMCIFTVRKQCLHDMMASCLVVRDSATEQEIATAMARIRP